MYTLMLTECSTLFYATINSLDKKKGRRGKRGEKKKTTENARVRIQQIEKSVIISIVDWEYTEKSKYTFIFIILGIIFFSYIVVS